MNKKFLSIVLAAGLALSFAGCGETPEPTPEPIVLTAPSNVKVTAEGVVTWDRVENATEYVITINGTAHTTTNPYYYLNVNENATVSVIARGENCEDSESSSTVTFTKQKVTIGIEGGAEIRSGKTLKLNAKVQGSTDKSVTWEVTDGSDFVSISKDGTLTAQVVDSDKVVTVKATSNADPEVSVTKKITVTAKTQLTQAMLDKLQSDKISYEGFLNISLYTFGITNDFYRSYSSDIKTMMDGVNWYTEYADTDTGLVTGMYFQNHNDIACQVSVSFMNEENYTPMLDDNDREISWADAGLYNNFKGLSAGDELTVNDFVFNEDTWRWEYANKTDGLIERMVASANPYDFVPTNLALILENGEIAGIYSKAAPDRTIVQQYEAIQELTVAINVGDSVEVPTIPKFEYDAVHHAPLKEAIENMQALDSYSMDFLNIAGSSMSSGYSLEGFSETITADTCHFRPFTQNSYDDSATRRYTGADYGYIKHSETLYNSYSVKENGMLSPNRAFQADFSHAKPTFAFAPEIFNRYYEDKEEGTITYYVHESMSAVAALFYYGVGNDIALYGMFATEGQTSATTSFTPFVTVKDGYIVDAGFYYYLGYLYGVIEITYGDFNATTTPDEAASLLDGMEVRQVPTSWSQVEIITTPDSTDTENMENGLVYLKNFFGDEEIEEHLPFFAPAIGDTYGFGLTTIRVPAGENVAQSSIVFYYDVPLDEDYTIESSIRAVEKLLSENGFVKNRAGVFTKGHIAVQVVDSSLDLNIYVWKV